MTSTRPVFAEHPGDPLSHVGESPVDVVFTFSFETYADARHRGMMRPPDRLLQTLQRSDRVRHLLVANPFRWRPAVSVRRVRGTDAAFPRTAHHSLHQPQRWRRRDPLDIDGLRREYARYDADLERAARARGLERPHVITAHPLIAGFAPFRWAESVTYFGRDDWSSHYDWRDYWPAFRASYDEMAKQGRRVLAVSDEIIDRIAPTGAHAVIPNGVEPSEWQGDVPREPEWLARIPHPRATYTGTLDSRLDIPGIVSLATVHPDVQIILLGPVSDEAHVAPVRDLPNVHLPGGVGRAELVAVLRHTDVCLLAHRRTPLTEAMSPLKIYEYLAAGCPVLAVDLPPVRSLGDRVILLDSVEEFADALPAALALGMASDEQREEFIGANSWSARHEHMLRIAFAPAM